jgi:hypothetical protein
MSEIGIRVAPGAQAGDVLAGSCWLTFVAIAALIAALACRSPHGGPPGSIR